MLRVLYVEDNEMNAQLVRRVLTHEGYEVVHAPDGLAGIESAKRRTPDVVLMDLGLPGMDGYEVARKMREIPSLREVPIVALSASVREVDRERALAEGFTGFIEKPIRIDSLRKDLARMLAKPARGRGR